MALIMNNNKKVAAIVLPLSAAAVLLAYFTAAQDPTSDSFFTLHIQTSEPPAPTISKSTMTEENDDGDMLFFDDEEVEDDSSAQKVQTPPVKEDDDDDVYQYSPPPHMLEPSAKGNKRGFFKRLFGKRRRKAEEPPVMMEKEENVVLADEPLGVFVDEVPLPPIVEASLPSSRRPEFDLATAGQPLAVLLGLFLLVVARRVFADGKVASEEEEEAQADARATNGGDAMSLASDHSVDDVEPRTSEEELELQQTLKREAAAKKNLEAENKALQDALHTHKSTVDKFNMELQARNERLSVFEQEQETVRKQLSSQIEVLKQELQERQKQEQGNLKSKESLCNDLITKIKALNQDLENHEKLWQGVAKKAEQKEAECAAKVESLQKSLKEEEQKRAAELQAKEQALAELNAKLKQLEAQHATRAAQVAACEQQMGSGVFPAAEEKLQAQLKTEQDHASSLSTKLQVFSAELKSREERVANLDAKMKEVERMSAAELKKLQQDLDEQVAHRQKLQQAAAEITRMLQEKQTQCAQLKTQWETSKAELQTLEEKVKALAKDVSKREAMAKERIGAMQIQLDEERDQLEACQQTSEATNEELIKKQEEFVQLTTRMDLFLKELQFRDEQVASLESKLQIQEELATSEIKALQSQLEEQTERRDAWNKSTEEVNQLLKDKKAQVVGLTTRADLFERELNNRQENLELLQAKIKERREAEEVKMDPYRKELRRLEEERDSWKEKTNEIGQVLQQKMRESASLTTRLDLFRIELAKRDDQLSALKTAYEEKMQAVNTDMAPIREKLEQQRQQRDFWKSKTEDIDRLLREKRAQCVGLKTRVDLFSKEVETKERAVADLEAIVADKEESGNAVITRLKQKLDEQVKARDDWKESTANVIDMLEYKKRNAEKLTVQLKGLVTDLQNYQQRRAKLESQVVHQTQLYGGRRLAMEEDLRLAKDHRDSWEVKTNEVIQCMKNTEQSIIGLETRVFLFEKELAQREEAVGKLRQEYWEMEPKSARKMEQLRGAIAAEKNLHEHGVETTVKLNKDLKTAKRECVGLTTRAHLFARELQKREDAVSEQEKKIQAMESDANVCLERLRTALQASEKLRDEWATKTKEVDELQKRNEDSIVGLDTRLQLFLGEVMKEEENLSRAIAKRATTREIDAIKERRDDWTTKALNIKKELKERREQVPGLKTRKNLFHGELDKREQRVAEVKAQLEEKEKVTAANLEPLRKVLKQWEQQRDEWVANVKRINETLHERERQCLPISKRLEEVIDQITHCKERGEQLEEQLRDEQRYYDNTVMVLKARLDQQNQDLSDWRKNTNDVKQLLKEKKTGVEGLKTRLHVFRAELRKRDEVVAEIEAKIDANNRTLVDELDALHAQIEAEQSERDRIIEETMAKNQALKEIEDTCAAMAVRRRLFEVELRSREEQATLLEAKHTEKEYDHLAQMKRLNNELSVRRDDRDKWRDSTQAMANLLKETEQECVGLATRSQLFHLETEKYEKQVAETEDVVARKEADTAESIAPLQHKLQEEQKLRDDWGQKTVALDAQLRDTNREVIGLDTRSKLFNRELKQKDDVVAALSAKIKEREDEFSDRMQPLLDESKKLEADRDKWERSTSDVQKMLERTKTECASIPTRLDLFRREQQTRNNAVADLEKSIRNKEELVAVQMGFLLNELQLQQKQRGKWKKVTLEMHRMLKETKEQVELLTERLDAGNAELKKREGQVASLAAALRDGRGMVTQQLDTLSREVNRQTERRDKLRESTEKLKDMLEKTQEQCKDLTEKLATTEAQVQECATTIESLEAKVAEKKALDASQIESIKGQLKIHGGQRAEWRENTNQMKQRLKEKQTLCTGLKTKLILLKNLQKGDVRSCLQDGTGALAAGITGQSEKSSNITISVGKRSVAEEDLTAKMDVLERELRKQQEEEKNLADSTQGVSSVQKKSVSSDVDVDRILAEKEKKQSSLNSKLASLTGALENL